MNGRPIVLNLPRRRLIDRDQRAILVEIRIVFEFVPIEHRAHRNALGAEFLGERVLVVLHRVFLDALVHFLLVLIASVRRAELRIGEPILEPMALQKFSNPFCDC